MNQLLRIDGTYSSSTGGRITQTHRNKEKSHQNNKKIEKIEIEKNEIRTQNAQQYDTHLSRPHTLRTRSRPPEINPVPPGKKASEVT